MANTIVLPYTVITNPHIPKRYHLRRSTTTNTKQKLHSTSSYIVHNSISNLPDIVNDCHNRHNEIITSNNEMKLMCKEIAHSLRLVADQVDKKYCQDSEFNRNLYCLSIRLVFHTTHIRTMLYTLWTRTFLPFILLIYKTKKFF
ncbi:unnamed protein product [Rotaria sp. Silwood1]|nr:unnamed protein product [Rotaria sp. Silwood1]CAF3717080.1 unnamed protein product [Rotaria sp. Silwood1]CAF4494936.1 unnamed protein product [Rotaria sp. Silwood1]